MRERFSDRRRRLLSEVFQTGGVHGHAVHESGAPGAARVSVMAARAA